MLRRAERTRRRLFSVPFATAIACIGINNGLTVFISKRSVVSAALPTFFQSLWAIFYIIAGIMILIGIGMGARNIEAAGCIAFCGGSLINALAVADVLGWTSWNSICVLLLFSIFSFIRAMNIMQGKVLVLLKVVNGDGDDFSSTPR